MLGFHHCLWIAICSTVFVYILTGEHQIFFWYHKILARLASKGFIWLAKPLGMCAECFSGQVAFWGYIVITPFENSLHYYIFLIRFVFFSIFLSFILSKYVYGNE